MGSITQAPEGYKYVFLNLQQLKQALDLSFIPLVTYYTPT